MRQSVLGFDGGFAQLRWTGIQLNAAVSRPHVDGTNTPGTKAVAMACGDFRGGEFLVWESRWGRGTLARLPLDSCAYGVDVCNRAL